MSSAYAARHGILPVQVTTKEVVIATAEPFVREWERELGPILRKDIRRVVANPNDISRYLVEFFNLAKSVKTAAQKGDDTRLSSFEQLVDLGKANRQYDANDQHIVHIVDWLWQYAFDHSEPLAARPLSSAMAGCPPSLAYDKSRKARKRAGR